MNENKFIQLLKKGDEKAFETLYNEYASKIYGLLRSYLKEDEIEDALQDVYVRIYRGIKGFKQRSKLSTWIYKITVNTAKNYLKKQKKNYLSLDFNLEKNKFTSKENVEKDVFDEIDYEFILNSIEKLPPLDKTIIKLRDIEGLSYYEISKIIDKPVGTVKSRLHYSRKKLQKIIEEDQNEGNG
ncbi:MULTISPECIES: RNA polymerase sigma factor [Oceanotoga]|jgi:RNA polymerase sigma-70 factor (ECF subfamily)|uniref:RNA polymerase RpoE-like sigma-24 subunit n=1 Tax=Oceanotoga teriensis TaxID=515440 RepID=A0AA45HJM2_9BACT|nr:MULTISPECIES: sigma-70 family RNA polymerase sigma factor [Oceanotoga]MDN5343798.1 hypothetical protein [Oceanotoga sp.]MDO7975563.1 sigma-70 family RNA polymerase sigma factor [Oceanotoga teriensis]PWJ96148.1 RNA polymerase RpoE-like sigma-24 subunit [Oceanotoga teriensis]